MDVKEKRLLDKRISRRTFLTLLGGASALATLGSAGLARAASYSQKDQSSTQHSNVLDVLSAPASARPTGDAVITVRPGDSIQAAIDSLPSDGGTVHLSRGTHEITTSIYIRSNLVLEGEGPDGTVIQVKDAYIQNFTGLTAVPGIEAVGMLNLRDGGVHDLVVRDLKLDGRIPTDTRNRDGSDGKGGEHLKRPWGIVLVDRNGKSNDRFEFSNVEVTRTQMGVHIKGTQDLTLKDSYVHRNGGVLLYYHNMYLRRTQSVLIENSVFEDGYSANGLNLTLQQDITVRHNRFLDNYFRGCRAAASQSVVIADNLMRHTQTQYGLILTVEGTGVDSFVLDRNLILSNHDGMGVFGASNGVLSDNMLCSNENGDKVMLGGDSNVVQSNNPPSVSSLEALVQQMAEFGLIDNRGIAISLRKQLEQGRLADFVREVQLQDGGHVTSDAAKCLLREAHKLGDRNSTWRIGCRSGLLTRMNERNWGSEICIDVIFQAASTLCHASTGWYSHLQA